MPVSYTHLMIYTWIRFGKPDVSLSLNGSLAGLVAITAGCDNVDNVGAMIIGAVAGLLLCLSLIHIFLYHKELHPVCLMLSDT